MIQENKDLECVQNEFFEEQVLEVDKEVLLKELLHEVRTLKYNKDESVKIWSKTHQFKEVVIYLNAIFNSNSCPTSFVAALKTYYENKLNKLTKDEIPTILNEMGVNQLTTDDGIKVTMKSDVYVTEKTDYLYEWLEDNGYKDHIKSVFKFGKGEANKELFSFLKEKGYSFAHKDEVHYQTLNKIMRDVVQKGYEYPPEEACKVTPYNYVTVK